MSVQHLEANGRRLAYVRRGQGAPLLLIQGMSFHHQMWGDWFLDLLAPHFDVVAYDHRGMGTSDRVDEPFSIADLADDAAAVIEAVGWEDAHVFGVSMGGMVAQELALRHPEVVRGLAVGCSYAGGPGGVLSETVRRMLDAMWTKNLEHSLRTAYEGNLSPKFAADPANYELYVDLTLAQRAPSAVIFMQWEAVQEHNTSERLGDITAPTLVLHGTADSVMAGSNSEQIASLIPGARLEWLDGAGHAFWWEEPKRAAVLLVEHLVG
jgi:pimeloyl-ACP methyl ester carboxylesterase